MTHPAIVRPFTNADHKFADPPFEDSDWFDVDRRRVGDSVVPLIMEGKNDQLANIFLESLFAGTQFGLLSKYHTTLAYKLGIADPLTSEVRLCTQLAKRTQLIDRVRGRRPVICSVEPSTEGNKASRSLPRNGNSRRRSSSILTRTFHDGPTLKMGD